MKAKYFSTSMVLLLRKQLLRTSLCYMFDLARSDRLEDIRKEEVNIRNTTVVFSRKIIGFTQDSVI
jgi:hypothetical protein